MYHQFKELADVDITKEPMEVGPTCHYVMGGVEVDPDTGDVEGARPVRGRRGAPAACTAPTGSAATRCPTCWCSAAAPAPGAAEYVDGLAGVRPAVRDRRRGARPQERALLPFSSATEGGENPFVVQLELQKTMNDLVGIIRKADEMELALKALQDIAVRTRTVSVEGHREFNPGWHLALDLRNMLLVSLCVAKAALERQESRGGHTRDDYPVMDSDWRHVLLVLSALGEDDVELVRQEQVPMRPELLDLFELDELKKYYTGEELGGHRADTGRDRHDATTPHFRVWRGDDEKGELVDYPVEVNEGEVVLDIIHRLQQTEAQDLAVRWNCKAGKCGSCSAEINGRPRLMCMTRMSTFERERGHHGHAAAHVPGDPRPRHRRVVQLHEGPGDPALRAAAGPGAGRVPDAAGRRGAEPGVPQVHRVLPVPEHLPRGA